MLRAVVPNGSRSNVLLMLQRSFSDRITVTYPDMGIAEDFFVEGRRITVGEGWTAVTAELLVAGGVGVVDRAFRHDDGSVN